MSEAVLSPVRIGRLSIGALGVLALALGSLQSVVGPALPLLQRELGVSPAEGALIGNTLLVTGAVVAPVTGKLGDRYGAKRVLVLLPDHRGRYAGLLYGRIGPGRMGSDALSGVRQGLGGVSYGDGVPVPRCRWQ